MTGPRPPSSAPSLPERLRLLQRDMTACAAALEAEGYGAKASEMRGASDLLDDWIAAIQRPSSGQRARAGKAGRP